VWGGCRCESYYPVGNTTGCRSPRICQNGDSVMKKKRTTFVYYEVISGLVCIQTVVWFSVGSRCSLIFSFFDFLNSRGVSIRFLGK
jgi:hypothetical protein